MEFEKLLVLADIDTGTIQDDAYKSKDKIVHQ